MLKTLEELESNVACYYRKFPGIFSKGKNAHLFTTEGEQYIDFFSAASSLNYGHNNPLLKEKVIEYLSNDGIVQSLDMATEQKIKFINSFKEVILKPRDLDYKIQFLVTGTNSVEAAIKLARKVKKRPGIIAFTNSFHGCTQGALMVSGDSHFKADTHNQLNVDFFPYEGYLKNIDTLDLLEKSLSDTGSGVRVPSAIIVETVQIEGGMNMASISWLQRLEKICKKYDIILIIDDIQAGNGRMGTYFSFEEAGIKPDMVLLSKSLGGYGFPLSVLLINPEMDIWSVGEHTGTFRGNNLAFLCGNEVLQHYWSTNDFQIEVAKKAKIIQAKLAEWEGIWTGLETIGKGFLYGLKLPKDKISTLQNACFENNLIIETCGYDSVLKIVPPLTVEESTLHEGLDIIEKELEKYV